MSPSSAHRPAKRSMALGRSRAFERLNLQARSSQSILTEIKSLDSGAFLPLSRCQSYPKQRLSRYLIGWFQTSFANVVGSESER
jgi:hypothetical protein